MALPTKKEKKKTVGKRGKKRSHNNGAVSPGSGLSQNGKKKSLESPVPPMTTSPPESGGNTALSASSTPPPPVLEPETGSKDLDLRLIPRLVDTDGQTAVPRGARDENLDPGSWTCDDVAQFLEINEIKCDPLVEAIIEQKVDGQKFLSLKQADLMKLANKKIWPSAQSGKSSSVVESP